MPMIPKHQEYMNRWGTFYKDLYYGRRAPKTPAQRDFIKHIKMRLGTNEHERAFLAWLNLPKEKVQKKKRPANQPALRRRPRKRPKDEALEWMRRKPVPPPPLPEPAGIKEKPIKPNYDILSSGKAHGDQERRLRERQKDRWGGRADK